MLVAPRPLVGQLVLERWDELQVAYSSALATSTINGIAASDPVPPDNPPPYHFGGFGPTTHVFSHVSDAQTVGGLTYGTDAFGRGSTIQWISGTTSHPALGGIAQGEAKSEIYLPGQPANPLPQLSAIGQSRSRTRASAWYAIDQNVYPEDNLGPYSVAVTTRFQWSGFGDEPDAGTRMNVDIGPKELRADWSPSNNAWFIYEAEDGGVWSMVDLELGKTLDSTVNTGFGTTYSAEVRAEVECNDERTYERTTENLLGPLYTQKRAQVDLDFVVSGSP